MKRLYLTSSVNFVAKRIVKDLKPQKPNNKLVFISTASEVEKGDLKWLENDKNSLKNVGFDVFDYTVTDKREVEIRSSLKNVNYIFVAGGNTFYLLEKSQQSGFIDVIRDFVLKENKIYIGSSAGSVIASPDIYPILNIDDASFAPDLKGYQGYDLVDFIVFPHWGNEIFKDKYLNQRLDHSFNGTSQTIFLRDNQYVEVKDNWYRIVEV